MELKPSELVRASYLNLIPPPPKSFAKLPRKEREEITNYIYTHAEDIYNLLKEKLREEHEAREKRLMNIIHFLYYLSWFFLIAIGILFWICSKNAN